MRRKTLYLIWLCTLVAVGPLAGCANPSIGRDLAASRNATPEQLTKLARVDDGATVSNVAANPNTPEAVLLGLAENAKAVSGLLRNPNSTARVLETALATRSRDRKLLFLFHRVLLEHPAVNVTILEKVAAASRHDYESKYKIATHPLVTAQALDSIIDDTDPGGYDATYLPVTSMHPLTPAPTLARLARALETEASEFASEQAAMEGRDDGGDEETPPYTEWLAMLLQNDRLDVESRWILTRLDNSRWTRRRLYRHRDAATLIRNIDATDALAWQARIERDDTTVNAAAVKQRVEEFMLTEAAETVDERIEHRLRKSALAARMAIMDVTRSFPGASVDFLQSVVFDDVYHGDCPSIRIVVEGLRIEARAAPNSPVWTFDIGGKRPDDYLLCAPDRGTDSASRSFDGLRVGYRSVDLEALQADLTRVLRGQGFGDPFRIPEVEALVAETDRDFTWHELEQRFAWDGRNERANIRVQEEGLVDRQVYEPRRADAARIAVGRMYVDNLHVDGAVVETATGLKFTAGTAVYRYAN